MDAKQAAQLLSRGRDVIRGLTANISDEQARWKPAPDKWSILEVVSHLHDEETSDFRLHLHILFKRPQESWPPVDPETWCVERRYNERRLFESLETFTVERNKSIEWLTGLSDVDWDAGREHPKIGTIRAGDLLAAWVAHDYLHIGQLTRLHNAWIERIATPYSTRYAMP